MTFADRWASVCERIGEAAARSGRDPRRVTVVAAAKTFPATVVAAAVAAGVRDVGENYVQEAASKREAVAADVRWHLIGRLQRNKAGSAVAIFDWIHSVDSIGLVDALDRVGMRVGRPVRTLVQVNLGGEATKGGVSPESLESLCEAAAGRKGLTIDGLMTVPPPVSRAEDSRPHFARLRELADRTARLRLPGVAPKELSMGMSADFEVAVEEGATFVRLGTALFGARGRSR